MTELIKKDLRNSPSSESEDPINPSHYISPIGLEAIDVIEAFNLGFNLGNVLKYVFRAGKKPGEDVKTDLEKATWYLKREIERISK